jgi:iron complex outermembrane receptor protein
MKFSKMKVAVLSALAGTGSIAVPGQLAWAQEQTRGLEEIVVTSQRREQDLQEVPMSIVALTGENLELQGLDSLEDVGNTIPNLNIQGGGAGTYGTQFRVRGLPNVGVYVDGVWQVGTDGLLVTDFVDLDRVEVLRGPQGTTYGRDSTGGAIRMWTRRPSEELSGSLTATMGSYDRRDIKGTVNVPITDNLLTKWTASSLYRDGFIEGLTTGIDYGMLDQDVIRGDILWTPTDNFSARLVVNKDSVAMNEPRIQDGIFDTSYVPGPGGGAPPVQTWGVIPAQFYGLAVEGAAKRGVTLDLDAFAPENFQAGYPGGKVGKWESRSNAIVPSYIDRNQIMLDMTWDLTDNISIQSITAKTEQNRDINVDWENSDYTLVEDILRGELDLFSEEIQITGVMFDDRLNWMGGVYYWDQEAFNRDARYAINEFRTLPGHEGPQLDINDVFASDRCLALLDPVQNPNGLLPCQVVANAIILPNFAYDRLNRPEQDGIAYFAEGSWSFTDQLDLTLGIRYHDQDSSDQNFAISPNAAPLAPEGNAYTNGNPFLGTPVGAPTLVSFSETTYKAALQYQLTSDIMGYVSYSEGFDSGGVSSTTTSVGVVFFPYSPQVMENTEVGIRADLFDSQLRVNATLFSTDWLNIQNAGVVRDPATGAELPQLVTTNVGRASAEGFELEMTWLPTNNLMFNVNVGILDTSYDDIAAGTFSLDTSTEFAQAPDLTYNIGAQYEFGTGDGAVLTSRLDYSYTDQFWRSLPFLRMDWYGPRNGGPVPAGYDESGDWGTLNARVTYQSQDGTYSVSVFGTNLTDEYMLNSGFFHGIWGYNFATVSRPREFGASLTVNF